MDTFAVRQGSALPLVVTLSDDQGRPITRYAGTETLAASLWPGGNLPSTCTPTATWVSGPLGTIAVAVSAAQTTALAEGRYKLTLAVTDPIYGLLEAYSAAVDILQAIGTAVAPTVYCAYPDLLQYGRAWLKTLASDDDLAGYAGQCGRARSWLDDLLLAGWQTSNALCLGDPGYGAVITGQGNGRIPSTWLRGILDAGGLIVRDQVREVAALKALSLICRDQIGPSDKGQAFARQGRIFGVEADQLAMTLRAEIDTNADGVPEFAINLGETQMR